MKACGVLKLFCAVAVFCIVLGTTQASSADSYNTGYSYGCPSCPMGEVCAGPRDKKMCVKPKTVGKRCGQDPYWVCKSGLTCEEGFCKIMEKGDCTAEGSLCVDGSVCAGSESMKKCVVPKRRGMRCMTPFDVCERGLRCEEGICKVGKGDDCKPKGSVCVDGTLCAGTEMEKKCVVGRTVRKRCGQDAFAVCEKDLTCEEGFCKNVKGGDCSGEDSLCVDNTRCAGTEKMKKCVRPIDAGNRCGQDAFSVCKNGLICEEGVCKIEKGGDCKTKESLCVEGTICAKGGDMKRCVVGKDVRQRCEERLFSVCKEGLVCEEGFCKIPRGGDCSAKDSLCIDDTMCVGTKVGKKCVSPRDVGMRCGQSAFSVCRSGLMCDGGVCKIREGGDCSGKKSLCVSNTACIGTDGKGKCEMLGGLGDSCGNDGLSMCGADLKCVNGVCERRKIAVGGKCSKAGSMCVDGSVCVGGGERKLCVKLVRMGGRCGRKPFTMCERGLVCSSGICSKRNIGVGGDCSGKGSICSSGTICAGSSKKKRCVKPIEMGGRCGQDPFWVCRRGLKCVGGVCGQVNIPHGGMCVRKGSTCAKGTVCAGTTHEKRCVKPRPAGYRCGRNAFWVCRKGLKCESGVCKVPKGGLCRSREGLCEKGTVCAGSGESKRCTVAKRCGRRYGVWYGCSRGQKCEMGVCKIRSGGRCYKEGSICVEGSVCIGKGSKKTCVMLKKRGQKCGSTGVGECEGGLTCEGGVCKVSRGGDCRMKGSVCVKGTACAGHHLRRRCVVTVGVGKRCGTHSLRVCQKGLKCVYGVCRARIVGLGEDCSRADCGCGRGLICAWKHGRKVCVKRVKRSASGDDGKDDDGSDDSDDSDDDDSDDDDGKRD